MDFEVSPPLRIHLQPQADECTSCALAACAEDVLRQPVDPNYIYENSKDALFGITADKAMAALLNKGVIVEGQTTPIFPFKEVKSALPWVFRFNSMIRMLQRNNRSFFCGIDWQQEWEIGTTGIMSLPPQWNTWFHHAVKIYGFTKKNGIIYLKVQNSMGADKGDHGIWYMPQEIVINLKFAYQIV